MYEIDLSPIPPGYTHMVLSTGIETFYLLALTADSAEAGLMAEVGGVSTTKLMIKGSGSRVEVHSQKPYHAATMIYTFDWNGEQLRVTPAGVYDPTAEFFRARRQLISDGDLEAIMDRPVKDVLYPQSHPEYYEQPKAILGLAYRMALDAYRSGNVAKALWLVEYGIRQYSVVLGDPLDNSSERGLGLDVLVPIVNDYAFFQAENGKPAQAEPLLRRVIKLAPDRAVAYLNLGDVLWELDQRADSKPFYRRYLELLGRDTPEAPARVQERINQ